MFGFSIMKILFTIAVVVVVWQGFKWLQRRDRLAAARLREELKRESAGQTAGVEDMVECPDCGAYVAKGSNHRCT